MFTMVKMRKIGQDVYTGQDVYMRKIDGCTQD